VRSLDGRMYSWRLSGLTHSPRLVVALGSLLFAAQRPEGTPGPPFSAMPSVISALTQLLEFGRSTPVAAMASSCPPRQTAHRWHEAVLPGDRGVGICWLRTQTIGHSGCSRLPPRCRRRSAACTLGRSYRQRLPIQVCLLHKLAQRILCAADSSGHHIGRPHCENELFPQKNTLVSR